MKFVAVKDLNITCTLLSLVDNIYFRPNYAVSLTDIFSLTKYLCLLAPIEQVFLHPLACLWHTVFSLFLMSDKGQSPKWDVLHVPYHCQTCAGLKTWTTDFGTTLTLSCVGMGFVHYSCLQCLVLVPDCDFIMVSFTVQKVCATEFLLHFSINEDFLKVFICFNISSSSTVFCQTHTNTQKCMRKKFRILWREVSEMYHLFWYTYAQIMYLSIIHLTFSVTIILV
jgi:hypothetical protein